ncbi:MAG: UDP-N-acetylmuramate dehydrogenase [Tyzzerella sp.]|uniref:UDP-N-acetylenolpyruvoylglucosamine reductase n=1 Tax=Candidatus Fimicola merdigallinarum TaxID=2840819 RepID=A0A9D9DTY6_9FIRM|nr:UDP-N-acetylmuramate dehydrogenase [Candidatus Fimicola merdigallinarum]
MTKVKGLIDVIGEDKVLFDEPMKNHISFKVGGNADAVVQPSNEEELSKVLKYVKENDIPYYIMGNGSNIIVGDKGFRGVIIKIFSRMCHIEVIGDTMDIKAGALMGVIGQKALENSLTGFEFGAGIPGTFGGAVCMNAGAYDGEMKDILLSVRVMTSDGEIKELDAKDLDLSYRHSIIQDTDYIVLSGKIKLKKGNYDDIKAKMSEFSASRREKQPLNYPSAGSTFKRPEGNFAGKLISDAGLKGYSVNGAEVSEKHAGFVINKDNAKAEDVLEVIKHCQKEVYEKFGVKLETEVKIIGEF